MVACARPLSSYPVHQRALAMANELWNVTVFPEPTTVGKNRKGEKPTEALQKGTAKTHEARTRTRTRTRHYVEYMMHYLALFHISDSNY